MTTDEHIETPECGFDRNASHSAGHYVCACGYEPIDAGARGSDTERVGNVQPSHAAPAPNDLAAMEQRITELERTVNNVSRQYLDEHERAERAEAELALAKSIALDAESEARIANERNHAMSQACDEAHDQFQRAEAENAALREDAERYRWFRLQSLWDADRFPWPKDFEYPESILQDDGAMLDAAIDAARKMT